MSRLLSHPLFSILSLLIAMISVQFGAAFAKHLFSEIGVLTTVALRQGFAALMLLIAFRPWRAGLWPAGRRWKWLAIYGAVLGVMNLSFYMAIARIPLGIAVAIEFTGPLAVALMSSRKRLDFVWIACAGLGLLLLLPQGTDATALDPLGIVLALIAAVCWGSYILLGQKVGTQMSGGTAVSLGMAISCLITVPIGVAAAGPEVLAWGVVLAGLSVALLSSAIPYTVEMFALKTIPAKTFSILMSLEPAIAALAALIILSEFLSVLQWLAIGLIILASGGAALTARKSART